MKHLTFEQWRSTRQDVMDDHDRQVKLGISVFDFTNVAKVFVYAYDVFMFQMKDGTYWCPLDGWDKYGGRLDCESELWEYVQNM